MTGPSCPAREVFLRVDVDFHLCLDKGVPWLLNRFRERGIQATFFVVMGPDTMHRHAGRVRQRNYRQRLWSMSPLKLLWHIVPAFLASRFLGRQVGPDFPQLLHRIEQEGHQLGIHGHDHAAWADQVFSQDPSATRWQMEEALRLFNAIAPASAWAWAAPNWRLNQTMLQWLADHGAEYSSDSRGMAPYLPVIDGNINPVWQYPISLPCIHELIQVGVPAREVPGLYQRLLTPEYNLMCIHGYYEGVLRRPLFLDVMQRLLDQGVRFRPLREAHAQRHRWPAKPEEVVRIMVPGGRGEVSCPESFLHRNYFTHLAPWIR